MEWYFPVNLVKFIRTHFFTEHLPATVSFFFRKAYIFNPSYMNGEHFGPGSLLEGEEQ